MNVSFIQFDESAVVILNVLAQHFPTPTEIGFNDIFPDIESDVDKRSAHIGTLAFLRHEDVIAHDVGSASSFILTRKGLALFNEDIFKHLKEQLNDDENTI
ncbi:hypothetical protein CMT41_14740 [Colwellia sp. MT41]|uniref:Transcriptional regulator n=1 Tax=Colwellia marinimaniae TaxID=1513592 RepID=A0ABQ0MQM9_9GAMM|nr:MULTISPECIES: hypothetical protein [Colwellia]ALO35836.1 hypothetical protein CMT41_14740 [Colwellia sp. MT41]GAW94682.1 hypothetical protein MTCD1_00279 [Colwellia marinimaniae]